MKALFRMLASWWFTVALLVLFVVVYLTTGEGPDSSDRGFYSLLFFSPGGMLLFGLLVLNIISVSVRVVASSLSLKPPRKEQMDALVVLKPERWSEVRDTLREFSLPRKPPEGLFYKKLRRWSFLPGTLLRFSILIVLLSLFVGVHIEKRGVMTIHTGDELSEGVRVKSINATLQEDYLQIGQEGDFSVNEAEAVLQRGSKQYRVTSLMPVRVGDRYMRVFHLGYYREITIKDKRGSIKMVRELDLLPPGKTTILPVSGRDYFLTITLSPERTIRKGILTGNQFNLRKPAFRVLLQKGSEKVTVTKTVLRDNESLRVDGKLVSIRDRGLYARLLYVRNPVYGILKIGIMLLVVSLLFMITRFFWYKKEVLIYTDGDRLVVSYREEFYRKWAVTRFQKAFEGLSIV